MKKPITLLVLLLFLPHFSLAGEPVPPQVEMKNPKWLENGLTTGGQPSRQDLGRLKGAGYTTVINLRLPGETTKVANPARHDDFNFDEAARAESLGLAYFNLPVDGAAGLTRENAEALAAVLAAADGPVLLHCASGNRAGSLLALKAFYVDGIPADEALALGLAAGMTGHRQHIRTLIAQDADK